MAAMAHNSTSGAIRKAWAITESFWSRWCFYVFLANSSFPALKTPGFFLLNLHCPLFSVKSCHIFAENLSSPELDGFKYPIFPEFHAFVP